MVCQDARQRVSGFIGMNGGYLCAQRNLRVRNQRRKKKRVGVPTCCAIDPNNGQCNHFVLQLNIPFIGTISDQASGMSTSAGNKVQIERIYRFIIKILRNKVVVFCFNCYHRNGHSGSYVVVLKQKSNFGRGDFCFSISYNQT